MKSTATSCAVAIRCYDSALVTLLRCNHCRVIVDVGTSSSGSCAGCGGSLAPPEPAEATVWDDDPTERRPTDYFKQLESRR